MFNVEFSISGRIFHTETFKFNKNLKLGDLFTLGFCHFDFNNILYIFDRDLSLLLLPHYIQLLNYFTFTILVYKKIKIGRQRQLLTKHRHYFINCLENLNKKITIFKLRNGCDNKIPTIRIILNRIKSNLYSSYTTHKNLSLLLTYNARCHYSIYPHLYIIINNYLDFLPKRSKKYYTNNIIDYFYNYWGQSYMMIKNNVSDFIPKDVLNEICLKMLKIYLFV